MTRNLLTLLLVMVVGACTPSETPCDCQPKPQPPAKAEQLRLLSADFAQLPGWEDDQQEQALPALRKSCDNLLKQPDDRPLGGSMGTTIGDWRPACEAAQTLTAADTATARDFLQRYFRPYAVIAETAQGEISQNGLMTGYYEPILRGSLQSGGPYRVPLYRRPPDLVSVNLGNFERDLRGRTLAGRVHNGRLVSYLSRGEIDNGGLAGQGLELLWLDDLGEAFFLHIQGSGQVRLENGQLIRVGFDGHNGFPYASIGREMIKQGIFSAHQASAERIKSWLRDNPDQAEALMAHNRRYVFFRQLTGEGPLGAQGVALTAQRSLAVDRRFWPLGVPLWLDTTYPLAEDRPLQRLMIAQDTGGAITGVIRGDFFWGSGDEAGRQAGSMKQQGALYVLLPKDATPFGLDSHNRSQE